MAGQPRIHDLHDAKTGTWQYIVADPASRSAAIIDSVLDFDPATAKASTGNADSLLALVKEHGYQVDLILETHAHADHLTAAGYLQAELAKTQAKKPATGIGKRIKEVQSRFGQRYHVDAQEYSNVFDKLFDDGDQITIGNLTGTVLYLPGHTPDHVGYRIGENIFCGDSLFNADVGSARCDFPGGDAKQLFASVRKLLSHPEQYKIWTGHDYPPDTRGGPKAFMTVGEQRASNKHLKDGVAQDEFVAWRTERDATLSEPRLIHQALQVNIRAGQLPQATAGGDRLLHVPIKSEKSW
ncbi:metallo-beta-lactamase domain-containingprotein [Purpureocillium lavendulum]|uniref:Metallo-beta-lactamase domain-containingprotein n=1 Tax=Purpureocillium lavendulum TaxID=1247861 RepID=A0AB34FK16_9HYPO|nr:metallo-beta-lactamase domain-containingprotein [Purpureocillium lavendulum]